MALPKLNSDPKYKVTVPSTGKEVSFRPYLVKEEKVLMMAFESKDQKQALRAIVDTLSACIDEEMDISALKTFDIEYLFTQIRSKSVGENSTVYLSCTECGSKNEQNVDITSVEVTKPEKDPIIELTPSISVEMDYPSYENVMNTDLEGDEIEVGFSMVVNSIKSIITEDERTDAKDVNKKELVEFVESMNQIQFQQVSDFLNQIPAMEHDVKFDCKDCGHHNEIKLKGIQDFLS